MQQMLQGWMLMDEHQAGWGLSKHYEFWETYIPFLLSYTIRSSIHSQQGEIFQCFLWELDQSMKDTHS